MNKSGDRHALERITLPDVRGTRKDSSRGQGAKRTNRFAARAASVDPEKVGDVIYHPPDCHSVEVVNCFIFKEGGGSRRVL